VPANFIEEIGAAITVIERALGGNPRNARGWY
jgi:hypothetical protein